MVEPEISDDVRPRPLRHWGRWLGATAVLLMVAVVAYVALSSPNVKWSKVPAYVFNSRIIAGLWMTLRLTFICMVIGVVIGTMSALMRLSENPVLRWVSGGYLWLFRGTPQLVQIIFWFNIALFVPTIGFGSWSLDTNKVITSFVAAVLALGLNEGAYMTEIIRAGIVSVPRGQIAAAHALGMRPWQVTRHVVLPQALRVILPPTGNQLNLLVKSTSLVSVIAAQDLLNEAQLIYQQTFLVIELLVVACIWYLVLTSLISMGQRWLEERVSPYGAQLIADRKRRRSRGWARLGRGQ